MYGMNKFLCSFCLFPIQIAAQNFSGITVNGNLKDLSFISELNKQVTALFNISNTTNDTVYIKNIELPLYVSSPFRIKQILPKTSVDVLLEYAVEGLPGRFFKTALINTQIKNTFITIPLSIKGYVIEKELLYGNKELYSNITGVNVKPITDTLFSLSDMRFLNKKKFSEFINNITYEIDYVGIAIIRIELKLQTPYNKNETDKLITILKNNFIQELEKRKYSPEQIYFAVSEKPEESIQNTAIKAYIKLSSEYYSNEQLNTCGFLYDTLHQTIAADNYIDKYIYGYLSRNDVNIPITKHPDYKTFINKVLHAVLADGTAIIQMRYYGKNNLQLEKKNKLIQKKILKTLADKGINTKKIEFTIPYFEYTNSDKDEIMLVHFSPLSKEKQNNPFEFNIITPESKEKIIYNDLPIYKYNYTDDKKIFDDENGEFKSWLLPVINAIKENKKVKFIIEASAGNAPINEKKDNKYIARKRSEEIKKSLLFNLNQQGINKDKYTFTEPVILTQGPIYSAYLYKLSFYSQYQYVKVIPVYDTLISHEQSKNIYPYMINFNNNNFEIPLTSTVFQNFIERLVIAINQKGYVGVILESSSSRVPTSNYKDNLFLSFSRAEKTISLLREELIKKGINPDRLIINEQRILVQGPEYSNDYNKNSFIYEQYQYIKIIPEDLFKR